MHISLFIIGHLTTLILLIEYAKRKENQIISKGSVIPKHPLINIFIYLSYYISLIQIFRALHGSTNWTSHRGHVMIFS
jgi:hypothetical protein